jgi:hypothetical protein
MIALSSLYGSHDLLPIRDGMTPESGPPGMVQFLQIVVIFFFQL